MKPAKKSLELYVILIDRVLSQKGYDAIQRDQILNDAENINILVNGFKLDAHPILILNKLNYDVVNVMQ